LLLADEPTGALDTVSSDKVLDAMLLLADELGSAVLVVTHENRVSAHCERLVSLQDGRVISTVAGA
jgi:putative ABC transport system ATP-binding protein